MNKLYQEADIIMNGETLTPAMCMTIRVSLESFCVDLVAEGLGNDEMGIKLRDGYVECIKQIRNIMYKSGE